MAGLVISSESIQDLGRLPSRDVTGFHDHDAGSRKAVAWLYGPLILSSIFLEKIALPFAGNTLSVNTVVMPVIVAVALIRHRIHFDTTSLLTYLTFFMVTGLAFLLLVPENQMSLPALALIALVQFPLATRAGIGSFDHAKAMRFYSSTLFFVSLLAIAQFASEWFVPRPLSFPLDYYLPKSISLAGYNNLNPLEYASDKIKSNGVFFAEPSFFSQEVALAALIELNGKNRPGRILVFAAGLLVSYSGTGLLIFAPFGLYAIIRKKGVVPLLLIAALMVGCVFFADTLRLDTLTRRVSEFQTTGTSGNARFLSIFDLIQRFQISDAATILFGLGPGQILPFIKLLPYDGFGPTWGKLLFEYGLIGFCIYGFYLITIFRSASCSIKMPLLVTYLLLGGYLADTTFIALILMFVSWAPRPSLRCAESSPDAMYRSVGLAAARSPASGSAIGEDNLHSRKWSVCPDANPSGRQARGVQ